MSQESQLQQGIEAIKRGDKKGGATVLANVVRSQPQSAEAWYWLAAATENPNEAALCLQRVLQIDPGHGRARQALDTIQKGGTPSLSTFTGEAPNAAEPMAPNMRPLNTGELLGSSMDSPYGSYSPPTAAPVANPYGAPSSNPYAAPPPPNFGNEPTPPPPFGMPAWANQGDSSTTAPAPPPPSFAANVPPPPSFGAPPPPAPEFQPTAGYGGVRVASLDPAREAELRAAQEQAKQAEIQRNTGADLRASLLNPNAFQPQQPPTQAPPDPRNTKNVKGTEAQPKKGPKPTSGKAKISPLLIIALVVAILVTAGVIIFALLRQQQTPAIDPNTTTTAIAEVTISPTADAAASPATVSTTAPVTVALPTTAAPVVPATTAPPALATTAPPPPATTAAPVVPATTAPPPPPATTAPPPPATTAAPVNQTPLAPGQPTPTARPGQIFPTPTIIPTINGQIPADITAYVNEGNSFISQVETVIFGEFKALYAVGSNGATPGAVRTTVAGVCTPAEATSRGCLNAKSALVRNFMELVRQTQANPSLGYRFCFEGTNVTRTNTTTCRAVNNVSQQMQESITTLGSLSKNFKSVSVPSGVQNLGILGNDITVNLGEVARLIDQYFSTGNVNSLNEALIFYDRFVKDRDLWKKTIAAGYPYRVLIT
jgi:hypothetical protein